MSHMLAKALAELSVGELQVPVICVTYLLLFCHLGYNEGKASGFQIPEENLWGGPG